MAFAQTFPIDLAILFAGDTLMYLEIVVIVRLAAGMEHFRYALRLTAQLFRLAIRMVRAIASQPVARINRLRERRSPARSVKPRAPNRSEDDRAFGTAWGTLAAA
jgi:hypothetical protein